VGLSFKPADFMGLMGSIDAIVYDNALIAELKQNCRASAGKYERNQLATNTLYHLGGIIE